MTDDLDFEDLLPLISTPAEAHDPGLSRRHFLQGAVAVAAVAAAGPMVPAALGRSRAVAAPGDPDCILVDVFIGGGNDGLNTVVPRAGAPRARYDALRSGVSVPSGDIRPLDDEWGLHPSLTNLHSRFGRGGVAVVQGAGLAGSDLSHLTAMQHMMAGATTGNGTGWLGRFLDDVPGSADGLRAVAIGTSVPLFLSGRNTNVTSLPPDSVPWGAVRTGPEGTVIEAVAGFADEPTTLGPIGDAITQAGRLAIARAAEMGPIAEQAAGQTAVMSKQLSLAAHVINAGLGVRAVGVVVGGGWDTHIAQNTTHGPLLGELDTAIEVFFSTLSPAIRDRVVMLVQSEFGRRPESNVSGGTDHGTAAPMFVIGDAVAGGLHAAPASLDTFDENGNMVPTVDWRAVYHELIGTWMGGDADAVVGPHPGLSLFA